MSDGVLDWGALGGDNQQFAAANFCYVYDEARAQALARQDFGLLESYYNRHGNHFSGLSHIIEFGSDLTRGSDWLSQAGSLDITDIFESELLTTYERLKSKILYKTRIVMLKSLKTIYDLKICDLLYSVISLRHTPATVSSQIINLLLNKVAPGGIALIHAPTQHKHYQAMLPGTQEVEELNVIPQWKLFEMLDSNNFSLILVQEEPLFRAADVLYHTILAQRCI